MSKCVDSRLEVDPIPVRLEAVEQRLFNVSRDVLRGWVLADGILIACRTG